VKRSNEEAKRVGVAERVKFLQQDLFSTDFHEAAVLTLYLLPDVNIALRPKILAELKPGTRVVSHDYGMGEWRPDAQETVPAPDKTVGTRKESMVYLWIVPARIEGEWILSSARGKDTADTTGSPAALSIRLRGGRADRTRRCADFDGRLRGNEVRLVLPPGRSTAVRSSWSGA